MARRSVTPYRSAEADDALVDRALDLYQPLSPDALSRDDGREIVYNLTGAFGLLLEWKRRKLAQATASTEAESTSDVPEVDDP